MELEAATAVRLRLKKEKDGQKILRVVYLIVKAYIPLWVRFVKIDLKRIFELLLGPWLSHCAYFLFERTFWS